jgi:DNA-binding transcriptional ArsR family regulator
VQCIELTAEDVARTGVLTVGPLAETLFALRVAQFRRTPKGFERWRTRIRADMSDRMRLVAPLFRPSGMLDLATVVGPVLDHDTAMAAVADAPAAAIRGEVEFLATYRELPAWTGDLARGDTRARALLRAGLDDAFRLALAPVWPRVRAWVEADRVRHAEALAAGGVAGLFAGLAPYARWRPPVLELANDHVDDVRLTGQGVFIVPSVFCWQPEHYRPPGGRGPSLLFVPAVSDPVAAAGLLSPDAADGALRALLGRSRAAVLERIAAEPGITTGCLADVLRCSAASASEHASILREAGLVRRVRDGASVRHEVTPLGLSLLHTAGNGV